MVTILIVTAVFAAAIAIVGILRLIPQDTHTTFPPRSKKPR